MSLQHAILGLLTHKPMTGYELKSIFDNSVNYFWTAQLSQIYRDLGTLESKGYVTSQIKPQQGRPDKKIYSITPKGDGAFQKWLNNFPKKLSIAIRDEICLRTFFGSRIQLEELEFQLRKFIKEKQEVVNALRMMDEHTDHCKDNTSSEKIFFQRLTIKKGLLVFGAEIQWAEECLKELDELKG
ncbi:MAG: PadR family transcriptional regulator [Actinobacteria bacterium]|nr:PadR family transcriptional regulator [Actinomycetota bacterium]